MLPAIISRQSTAARCPTPRGTNATRHQRHETPTPRGTNATRHHRHAAGCPLPRRWCLVSGQRGSGGRQSRATIPFSSMSRFSLLQIDVELEIRLRFIISSGGAHSFGRDNIYYMIYISMYNRILLRYRAPGLPPEHPECSRIFTEHKGCVRLANAIHPL